MTNQTDAQPEVLAALDNILRLDCAEDGLPRTVTGERLRKFLQSQPPTPAADDKTPGSVGEERAPQIPDVIRRALKQYRDEECFDDSEFAIAIDAFLSEAK